MVNVSINYYYFTALIKVEFEFIEELICDIKLRHQKLNLYCGNALS